MGYNYKLISDFIIVLNELGESGEKDVLYTVMFFTLCFQDWDLAVVQ